MDPKGNQKSRADDLTCELGLRPHVEAVVHNADGGDEQPAEKQADKLGPGEAVGERGMSHQADPGDGDDEPADDGESAPGGSGAVVDPPGAGLIYRAGGQGQPSDKGGEQQRRPAGQDEGKGEKAG